jgi:hypothetical protein
MSTFTLFYRISATRTFCFLGKVQIAKDHTDKFFLFDRGVPRSDAGNDEEIGSPKEMRSLSQRVLDEESS